MSPSRRVARSPAPARKEECVLLAIDIGNTEVTLGLFEGKRLTRSFRVSSETRRTADEAGLLLRQVFPSLDVAPAKAPRKSAPGPGAPAAVLASVVPPQTPIYVEAVKRLLGRPPLEVTADTAAGITIEYRDPHAVGADRIANAVAAIEKYGAPVIIVDFGTATTFDVILKGGRYRGGVIAPGILTGAEQLVRRAARLGAFELKTPKRVVGQSTEESLQSGVLYGAAGQVDAIVKRITAEERIRPRVIATGGLAKAIAPHAKTIERADADLTLHGLRLIHERQRSRGARN